MTSQNGGTKMAQNISKRSVGVAVVISIVAFVILWSAMSDTDSITITETYAQEKVDEKLPVKKEVSRLKQKMQIIVDKIDIDFQDGNILGVVAHATVITRFGNASVQIRTTGKPELKALAFYYRPETFEFSEFILSDEALKNSQKAGQIASNATKKLDRYLRHSGLLEGTDVSVAKGAEELTQLIRESAKPALENVIISYLSEHPIRRLDGVKGAVISLAIDDFTVSQDKLVIDFSLLTLTINIALLMLLFAAIIGVAMFFPFI